MKLYSHNSQYPKPIPFRIRLSDGTTRTDPSTFTEEEIVDAGYLEAQQKPVATNSQVVQWNSSSTDWEVRDKTEEEVQLELAQQWALVRQQRDQQIQSVAWKYERYSRHERLGLAQVDTLSSLDEYVQALANLPQTQSDPFNIVWPVLGDFNGN
jgi:hypothetical protein